MVEGLERERVQRGQERHVRPFAQRVAERHGAEGGQLGRQPVGQGLQPLVLLGFSDLGGRVGVVVRNVAAVAVAGIAGLRGGRVIDRLLLDLHLRLVLGPDEAALDRLPSVAVDRDERAGDGDVGGVEHDRPLVQRLDRGLDLAHAPVLLLGQFLGFG